MCQPRLRPRSTRRHDGTVTSCLAAVPAERMHLVLMLVLTFTTGVVDAVGYLGLDRVFTGNMTGNVVILGMAVVGAEDLPVLGPVLALVGVMAGAALLTIHVGAGLLLAAVLILAATLVGSTHGRLHISQP